MNDFKCKPDTHKKIQSILPLEVESIGSEEKKALTLMEKIQLIWGRK